MSFYKKISESKTLTKLFFIVCIVLTAGFLILIVIIHNKRDNLKISDTESTPEEENTEEPINVNTTEFENIVDNFTIKLGEVYLADIDNRSLIIKVDTDLIEIGEDMLYLYMREYTDPNSYIERRISIDHLVVGEKVLLLDETAETSQKTFKKVIVLKGNYSQENIDNMFM